MPSPTTRGQRTRDEILASATEVVLESGPDAFSLREVARRAQLAPSALYNHFPSREALVVAVALRALEELKTYLEKAPKTGAASQRLRELGGAYIRFAFERPTEYRLIFDCLTNPPTDWATYATIAEPFTLVLTACDAGIRSGEFVERDGTGADAIAYGLWALIHGHVSLRSRNLAQVSGDFDGMIGRSIDALLDGWSSAIREVRL